VLNKGQLCGQHNFIPMKTNPSHTQPGLHSCKSLQRTRKSTDCLLLSSESWWGLAGQTLPVAAAAPVLACTSTAAGTSLETGAAAAMQPSPQLGFGGAGAAAVSVVAWLVLVTSIAGGAQVEMVLRFYSSCGVSLS